MVMVLLFRINEKIVTPTTVILMTMVTIPGFLIHVFWLKDFSPAVMGYWLAGVPVVVVFAPLGALICVHMSRQDGSKPMHSSSHGKGDAVLLIHGMPSNGRLWDEVVRDVSRQHRCIVIDLPGMGDAPFLPYVPSYFTEVAAQIEEVPRRHRVKHWHVVGHDGGSAVAVQYAYLYPQQVDCLALLSPALLPDLEPFFLLDLLRKPILGELSAPLVNAVFWHVAMRRALPGARHAAPRSSFARTFRGIGEPWRLMRPVRWGQPEVVFQEFPSILKKLACPTLVIHGSRDILPESFARRATALIANSRLIALDSGHFIPLEQAAQVSRHLVTFFRSRRVEDVANLPRAQCPTNSSSKRHPLHSSRGRLGSSSRRTIKGRAALRK